MAHKFKNEYPEAMSSFLPVSALLMFLLYFGMHYLYHWSHNDLNDPILEGKSAYLNIPFFFVRMAIYFSGWILLTYLIKKNSLQQDLSNDIKIYNNGKVLSAIFMVFFAITSSTMSWDWIMSVDPHWYSTLFGWYVFIGLFSTGTAAIILVVGFLKWQGYLSYINKEHIHDLGKYLFAFSIFWMYLWYFQYMLIWYGHLPEETIYYAMRINNFHLMFFMVPILSFVVPFFALMTRNSKRNLKWISIISFIVLAGQWLNLYLMLSPGIIGKAAKVGILEIGFTCLYLGVFLYVIFLSLSKKTMTIIKHPLLKESLEYKT